MEVISSVKNNLIVKTKKYKEKFVGKLLLEGIKLIEEAFLQKIEIDYVLIDEKKYSDLIKDYTFLKSQNIVVVTESVLNSISDVKTPQGIVAICNIKNKELCVPKGNFLVLENIQDPGNMGTIIRSSRGTTFKDIYLINCVCPYNPKVVRSTMGSIFFENLYFFNSTKEFLTFSKENNLNLFVADMDGKDIFLIKNKINNIGIVIGNEGNGVSQELKNCCPNKISIPMKNGLESLNAGVASGILMYYFDNL